MVKLTSTVSRCRCKEIKSCQGRDITLCKLYGLKNKYVQPLYITKSSFNLKLVQTFSVALSQSYHQPVSNMRNQRPEACALYGKGVLLRLGQRPVVISNPASLYSVNTGSGCGLKTLGHSWYIQKLHGPCFHYWRENNPPAVPPGRPCPWATPTCPAAVDLWQGQNWPVCLTCMDALLSTLSALPSGVLGPSTSLLLDYLAGPMLRAS